MYIGIYIGIYILYTLCRIPYNLCPGVMAQATVGRRACLRFDFAAQGWRQGIRMCRHGRERERERERERGRERRKQEQTEKRTRKGTVEEAQVLHARGVQRHDAVVVAAHISRATAVSTHCNRTQGLQPRCFARHFLRARACAGLSGCLSGCLSVWLSVCLLVDYASSLADMSLKMQDAAGTATILLDVLRPGQSVHACASKMLDTYSAASPDFSIAFKTPCLRGTRNPRADDCAKYDACLCCRTCWLWQQRGGS